MPTAICQKCGATLRFEGLAGLCPKCGTVVRVAAQAQPVTAKKQDPSDAHAGQKSTTRSRQQADLSELESEEVFTPTVNQVRTGPFAGMDKRLVQGIVAAIVLVLLFGLYVALRPASTDVVVVAPAPVTPAPAPDPQPADPTPPPPPVAPVIQALANPTTSTTRNAASRPAWMALKPAVPALKAKPITDEMVEQTIKKAVVYLKSQFSGGKLLNPSDEDLFAGQDAICVYALLQAGLAVDDSDLGSSSPFMQEALDNLKQFSMSKNLATYGRSLRASALAVFDREADRAQLNKDRQWLLSSELGGRYSYEMPPPGTPPDGGPWDNSNCQYGVLGMWAAVQAGMAVPDKYWTDVEQHWLSCQGPTGGWDYRGCTGDGEISMTCAGITTLCVTAEQLELIASKGKKDARPKMSLAIQSALANLGTGDRVVSIFGGHNGYNLYGVERAALATGYRYFGDHDWYRELGAQEIKVQHTEGNFDGSDGANVETAFAVLFLSRGRQPLLLNKLRFDGDWNDRPRDAAKLTQFASGQLEKPFAWGVADLSRNWWDWLECPLLYITMDAAPDFSDEDCAKLRSYTEAGGMIFVHNEFGSKEVDGFVNSLVKRMYPDYPMTRLALDDPIYSSDFPIRKKPDLLAVSNGSRTLLVYSPKDITQDWVRYRFKDTHENPNLQLGINLFVTAAGKSNFRNRLSSPYEPVPDFNAIGTLPVSQIMYPGPWDREPKAYERFGRWFQNQTSIKLDVQPTALANLHRDAAPIALLTGNSGLDFSRMDLHALTQYVQKGGVLFIDSTGGNKAFAASVRDTLLPTAFPGMHTTSIPASDPILAGTGACMDPLPKPRVRNYAATLLTTAPPGVQYAPFGQGAVIISDLDVTTGLLGSGTYQIYGYTPAYCQSLVKNVILWTLSRYK